MSFEEADACRGEARKLHHRPLGWQGALRVTYYPEAIQDELDLSSDEAQQAVLED